MTRPEDWSLDHDPPRHQAVGGLLRQAENPPPGHDVDWARLHALVMRGAAAAWASGATRQWWDVIVQWRRVAAAASVAAMLAAGGLLWRSNGDEPELVVGDDAAPESVALARVVAAYPDDAVFSWFILTAGQDEFTTWDDR